MLCLQFLCLCLFFFREMDRLQRWSPSLNRRCLILQCALLVSLFSWPVSAGKPAVATPPIMDEWDKYPGMKSGVDGVAAVGFGTRLYVFGGSTNASHSGNNGVKTSAVLNTATKTWNPLPPMTSGRCCSAPVVWRDQIFVMGGMFDEEVFGEVEVYNATGNYWHHTLPLPTSRCCMAAVTFGNEFYIMGGGDNRGYALDVIEIYSPTKKSWRTVCSPQASARDTVVVGVGERRLFPVFRRCRGECFFLFLQRDLLQSAGCEAFGNMGNVGSATHFPPCTPPPLILSCFPLFPHIPPHSPAPPPHLPPIQNPYLMSSVAVHADA